MATTDSLPDLSVLALGIPDVLPPPPPSNDPAVPHAPKRVPKLSPEDRALAIRNALRYFKPEHHATLAPEFARELDERGHIYMYRFRPVAYAMKAYPLTAYPAKCRQAGAIMLMIMNNLDPAVAMFPHELITYGGNGGVFSNWAQYLLVMQYLSMMSEEQTLSLYSGHPMGLFPSHKDAPRVVVTNGMMVPNYSSREQYERLYALGVTQYGQMTAGSFCYIGSQGIVHGTTITFKNAGRKYLGVESLRGKVVVTSGLGGMSGAQGKAGVICEAVTVIAEVDPAALHKRHRQGWLMEVAESIDACIARIKVARAAKEVVSIGFLGNIVDLWERLADEPEMLVDLGSDQTSLHNPYGGGYYPAELSFEEGKRVLAEDPARFKTLVQASLRRHATAINKLAGRGMRFWDYGNSFLLEAGRAGADVYPAGAAPPPPSAGGSTAAVNRFRYPSYVQDIMGDIFSLGFGPFRWVCTSMDEADLRTTDRIAADVLKSLLPSAQAPSQAQIRDNIEWIEAAMQNQLVVGSQARILYADCIGRATIAVEFNKAIRDGRLRGPIVLSRDHHDVSGTDSPFRETSDVYDGSAICADMSVHNVIGDSFRGATWVALHNGGGCGWGEVMNGGFGLVLDGSEDAERRAQQMLFFDVLNGVSRRGWSGNANGQATIALAMATRPDLRVTMPNPVDESLLRHV